ncbi:apolipoprotein C-IV isoform X2 [Oreochromis aureus]|uniref:Apolipoprotein C-IV n=2 Tax=Oreochromis TaxID=8139 RepID=A0A669DL91_ORENI|nr:apolipoprotein C-IV isoform X2 [Oreochromis aureus]
MQACGPLLAQIEPAKEPDSPGLLQKLAARVRAAKNKVLAIGELAQGFAAAYYEDHIQPVTDSYVEWASGVKSSVWEKIQTTIDHYTPFNTTQVD